MLIAFSITPYAAKKLIEKLQQHQTVTSSIKCILVIFYLEDVHEKCMKKKTEKAEKM